jgi:hypothetical protein
MGSVFENEAVGSGLKRSQEIFLSFVNGQGNDFDLYKAVKRGLLASIYFSDDPQADLQAYTGSYLQQEIISEGLTRNIPAFSRFLRVAALCNGTIVNFTNNETPRCKPRGIHI